ncbi:Presenilin-2 [Choanephora cucurbitarum]|uniref:Presenilin-2 n=1 Tax=Choanephora cucurbitarum TaxID=101091 RepID=A0A1C7N530_9FUNG|nr:Presenilin-2 [Choanephora cucurbitarum]
MSSHLEEDVPDTAPLITSTQEQRQQQEVQPSTQEIQEEKRRKEIIQFYVEQLTLLFYPLIVTFALTCWIETTLAIDNSIVSNPWVVYDEVDSDSIGVRLGGSVLNAVVMVCGITVMTFTFVLCFKYRLYKLLFFWLGLSVFSVLGITASTLWIEMMNVYQMPLDYLTLIVCAWNFSIVGVIAVFWNSPLWIQQAYLIAISAVTSISMLRMPSWTTWTVLIAVAIYDLFAVLCPAGPLQLLISIAEERDEEIPALIYSVGMASFDTPDNQIVGGYTTQESKQRSIISSFTNWIPFYKNNHTGYHTVETQEEELPMSSSSVNDTRHPPRSLEATTEPTRTNRRSNQEEADEDEEDDMNAIKLGLGDFIFYSVLVGKASRTDAVTLCLCIISILIGLALTILILTIKRKALPALPFSIFFGSITYAISYFMTGPMIRQLNFDLISF